jgi:GTP-binding protein Era
VRPSACSTVSESPVTDAPQRRAGFVAILGAPNAGKSTLLNALVGAKVSIVSPKVQTTRTRVIGIAMAGECQLIFVDTPGIFMPKRRLERAMVQAAWQGAADADEILVVVDSANKSIAADTRRILDGLAGKRAVLVLNKIDLIKRESLLPKSAALNAAFPFAETFMVSATSGDGVDDLRRHLALRMPVGPWLYPEDELTDLPMRLMAAEITREQLFIQLHDEVPHQLAVESESWEEFKNGSVRVKQVVFVQREGQKAIVLGKGGSRIRRVGEAARRELEALLERPVHLFLFVKVREDWPEDPERFRMMGLDWAP